MRTLDRRASRQGWTHPRRTFDKRRRLQLALCVAAAAGIYLLEDAYDTLVEVVHSDWVAELIAAETNQTPWKWAVRHFLIFMDGSGAYEVAAESFEWLPERFAGE